MAKSKTKTVKKNAACYIGASATDAEAAIEATRAKAAEKLGGSDGLAVENAHGNGVTWRRTWKETISVQAAPVAAKAN